jgi:hypothetical protein
MVMVLSKAMRFRLDTVTAMPYDVRMTTTNIPNQPHVIVFASHTGRLSPCYAPSGNTSTISRDYAIFSDREIAEENLHLWGTSTYYFTVPASVLFDIETVQRFTKKDGV